MMGLHNGWDNMRKLVNLVFQGTAKVCFYNPEDRRWLSHAVGQPPLVVAPLAVEMTEFQDLPGSSTM